MGRTGGVANVRGEVAFVAQQVDLTLAAFPTESKAFSQAWIRNQTLKDNIMFDKPFSDKLYKKVSSRRVTRCVKIPSKRCWRPALWRLTSPNWPAATPLRSVRREST